MSELFTTHVSQLKDEYEQKQALFASQPAIVQRFIEAQARQMAEAFVENLPQVKFTLPDRIVTKMQQIDQSAQMTVPTNEREQIVGGVQNRLLRKNIKDELRHRLNELEQSPDQAISASAGLLRHVAAIHMVYNMLPSGRSVTYHSEEDEEIPTLPEFDEMEPESAITASTDAIAEDGKTDDGRGDLLVPFVPAARRFYLPQWVAFDDKDNLLVGSMKEAEAHLASMQKYVGVLHAARSLAPHITADEEFQKKRYGMLGQLINQGRALTRYKTREIIKGIKERAAAGSLNRGLRLSLPYFDDQDLRMDISNFEVIPAGRIMFVPAFVVRAANGEMAKVAQDTRFNASTRKHLMAELQMLEDAFFTPEE